MTRPRENGNGNGNGGWNHTSMSREDALALIVEERSREILETAVTQSAALTTFRRQNIGTSILKIPLLETFPTAYWLPSGSDDAPKPTTTMRWGRTQVTVAEIACIVTIPENVLDDTDYDLWGFVRERTAESIGRTLDQAVFFGTDAPEEFPEGGILAGAQAAGKVVDSSGSLFTDFSDAMGMVEADGYDPSQAYGTYSLRGTFRTATDNNGNPIYVPNFRQAQGGSDTIFGIPIEYVRNGAWDRDQATLIVGDPRFATLYVRQDITVRMLDQATVGGVNLAEQDSLGMRVKARYGFAVVAPRGISQTENPWPFAAITGTYGGGWQFEGGRSGGQQQGQVGGGQQGQIQGREGERQQPAKKAQPAKATP